MGFFDSFGRAVEHAVSDIAGAVAGVIKTVAGDLENAVKLAENVFSGYIQGVGQVLLVEGKIIVAAYQTLEMLYAELVQDAIGARPLRPTEIAKAQEVFKGSVPLDRVLICSLTGFGGSRFTLPGSMIAACAPIIPVIGPLVTLAFAVGGLLDKYIIFLGRDGYRNALDPLDGYPNGAVFIHELTHVWQGHNQAFPWSYVCDSAAMQCMCGRGHGRQGAYAYVPGDQWARYHAEQQAMLVQDWYSHHVAPKDNPLPPNGVTLPPQFNPEPSNLPPSGKLTSFSHGANERLGGTNIDQVYQAYMDCNVCPGQPYAPTVFPQAHPFRNVGRNLHPLRGVPTVHTSVLTAARNPAAAALFKSVPTMQTSVMSPLRNTSAASVFRRI
jgi:hypothetical protein